MARISQLEGLLRQNGIDPGHEGATSSLPSLPKYPGDSLSASVMRQEIKAPTTEPDGALKLPLDNPTWLKFMDKSTPDDGNNPISSSFTPATPELANAHPEPRHIFRLWQVFAERNNPVIKILHAPSTQQKILDVSWNLQSCSTSFHALLFSIYLLAVVSLSNEDCLQFFGEDRSQLLQRYRTIAWQALMAADLFHTRDLEVLQAFVLFSLANPRSDTSTTLSALAVRLALKMGLDSDADLQVVTVFEQEMRIRLWWQITTQDVLARHHFPGKAARDNDGLLTPSIRLPLNVDDSELHPDMTKLPVEHPRATEMIYVLVRYEGGAFGQRQRAQMLKTGFSAAAFDEIQKLFEEKYLRYCDPQIPLHHAAQSMMRFAMAGVSYRLGCHKADDTPASQDALMDMAIDVLEANQASRDNPFANQLLWTVSPVDLDAVIHILTKLRRQGSGDRASRAWKTMVKFWDEHIGGDWTDDAASHSSFFAKLADLTIEAWNVRVKGSDGIKGQEVANETRPSCIQQLQQLRPTAPSAPKHGTADELATYALDIADPNVPPSQSALEFLNADEFPADFLGYGNGFLYDFGFWSDVPQFQ